MSNHDVWDAVAATDGTPANSFEFLADLKIGGAFRRFADVTNMNPAFTPKTRARQTYAQKGVDAAIKYGESIVVTWDHEVIRDENGQYQPELQDLIDAAKANGQANLRELRFYDALGADYAFAGKWAIGVTRTNTDWDSAAMFTITATLYTFDGWIVNPVLTGNVPLIDAIDPSGAAAGATVYITGSEFTGMTAVTFGGTAATTKAVINDGLITAVVPAGAAGVVQVKVTTPAGVSAEFAYTRGA